MSSAALRFSALLFLLTLSGCDRLREVKQCRLLARDVNQAFDAIEARAKLGRDELVYAQVSKEYEAIAAKLEKFQGKPELARIVTELAAVLRTSARQTAALGTALGANNRNAAGVATRELEKLARHQKTLAKNIDEECRPR